MLTENLTSWDSRANITSWYDRFLPCCASLTLPDNLKDEERPGQHEGSHNRVEMTDSLTRCASDPDDGIHNG
jgi:hypothetical protein